MTATLGVPVLTLAASDALGTLIQLAIVVVWIVGMWKVFQKADEPGWASLVPFYNIYVILRIVGLPWWLLLLMLVPVVNIVVWCYVSHGLSKSFGCGIGTTLGLIFLPFVFYPILGFGPAQYGGGTR